jgi:NADH-quinone oxidoreductase subunit E
MSALSEEIRQKIRDLYPRYPSKQAITLPALHLVQDAHRCVSLEAIKEIAELLELHPSEIYDTMSFYGFFRPPERPLGKHRVWVCRSISCALRGGEELLEGICDRYHVHPGETTADGKLTIEYGECLGLCEGAPCLLIDDNCHGNLTDESAAKLLEQL